MNKRVMWATTFNTCRFIHPCVVIIVLSDFWAGTVISTLLDIRVFVLAIGALAGVLIDTDIGIDMLTLAEIIVSACVVEFVIPVSYTADVLSGVVIDVMIEALADMNENTLAAAMTAFEFVVSTPLKESMLFFWTPPSCWPVTALD